MKIIGILLLAVGVVGIILTILLTDAIGWGGLIAGITALLTGVVFVAASWRAEYRRNPGCCRNNV
ncbi:MAG: hypothetical protein E7327_10310 [Clostridiales bacterium]|nr:hypothetical protein [Clostridiales bacterium]